MPSHPRFLQAGGTAGKEAQAPGAAAAFAAKCLYYQRHHLVALIGRQGCSRGRGERRLEQAQAYTARLRLRTPAADEGIFIRTRLKKKADVELYHPDFSHNILVGLRAGMCCVQLPLGGRDTATR